MNPKNTALMGIKNKANQNREQKNKAETRKAVDYLGCAVVLGREIVQARGLLRAGRPQQSGRGGEECYRLSREEDWISLSAVLGELCPRAPAICRTEWASHSRTHEKASLQKVQQRTAPRAASASPEPQASKTGVCRDAGWPRARPGLPSTTQTHSSSGHIDTPGKARP